MNKLYAPKAAMTIMHNMVNECQAVMTHQIDKDLNMAMGRIAVELKKLINEREKRRTP